MTSKRADVSYHLEGMGLVGCLIATMLETHEIEFTWNDTQEKRTAWKASTGCVFPTGNELDALCYAHWRHYMKSGSVFARRMEEFTEWGRWSYISESPPHGGRSKGVVRWKKVGPLVLSNSLTLHLNVQAFVKATRAIYAEQETKKPRKKSKVIVTHGTAQASRFVWGWSAQASIDLGDDLVDQLGELGEERPCLYLRKGYEMTYVYPLPRSRRYYLGTSTINMSTQKSRDVRKEAKKAIARVEEATGGEAKVRGVHRGTLVEGWRPAGEDDLPWVGKEGSSRLLLRPMRGDGVRHFPHLWSQLHEQLECEICKEPDVERRY